MQHIPERMEPVFSFFILVNAYAFFVAQLTRVFRHHGKKRGSFLLSNLVALGAALLALLFAAQL